MEKEKVISELHSIREAICHKNYHFERDSIKNVNESNLSAGERSRKLSMEITKLLKEYRKYSLIFDKIVSEERKNKI